MKVSSLFLARSVVLGTMISILTLVFALPCHAADPKQADQAPKVAAPAAEKKDAVVVADASKAPKGSETKKVEDPALVGDDGDIGASSDLEDDSSDTAGSEEED